MLQNGNQKKYHGKKTRKIHLHGAENIFAYPTNFVQTLSIALLITVYKKTLSLYWLEAKKKLWSRKIKTYHMYEAICIFRACKSIVFKKSQNIRRLNSSSYEIENANSVFYTYKKKLDEMSRTREVQKRAIWLADASRPSSTKRKILRLVRALRRRIISTKMFSFVGVWRYVHTRQVANT